MRALNAAESRESLVADLPVAAASPCSRYARYNNLFGHIRSGVVICRPAPKGHGLVVVDLNPAAEQMECLRHEQAVGTTLSGFFLGIEVAAMRPLLALIRSGAPRASVVLRGRRAASPRRCLSIQMSRTATGEVVIIYDDGTGRMALEEQVHTQSEWLNAAAQMVPICTFLQDAGLRYVRVTGAPDGLAASIAAGLSDYDRVPDPYAIHSVEAKTRVMRSGVTEHGELKVQVGDRSRWFEWRYQAHRGPQNRVVGIIGSLREVSDMKAMADNRASLAEALEHGLGPTALVGSDGALTYANKAWTRLWRLPADWRAAGTPIAALWPNAPEALTGADGLWPESRWESDIKALRPDGSVFPAHVACAPRLSADGVPIGASVSCQDMTALERSSEKRHAAERQAAALAAEIGMAQEAERRALAAALHDSVGQLLALAKITLAEARRDAADTPLAPRLQTVHTLVQEAIDLTRSLTSELCPPPLFNSGLEAAVEHLAQQLSTRFGVEFVVVVASKPLELQDPMKKKLLYRSVRELMVNVVKHANATHTSVTFSVADGGLTVVVRDDGVGFPIQAVRGRPRTRASFGLVSIRERLAAFKGTLSVSSYPDRGATVTLAVPCDGREGES
jgi:signal transduction histidine kinase